MCVYIFIVIFICIYIYIYMYMCVACRKVSRPTPASCSRRSTTPAPKRGCGGRRRLDGYLGQRVPRPKVLGCA